MPSPDDVEYLRQYDEAVGEAEQVLSARKGAYYRIFYGNATVEDRLVVLEDLARFCRAHQSTFHENAAMSDRLDGRREVWLRIQQYLQLTDVQLWALHKVPPRKGL